MATEAALPDVAAVAAEADAFAAALAARIAGEPQLRWQGMPSDGDSRTAYAALGEAGWIGAALARGARRARALAAAHRRVRGALRLPLAAALGLPALGQDDRQRARALRRRPALQERLLPEVAAGRLLFCQGFSEPDAGSDLAALRTTARDAGDRFVVSGRKLWTSSADVADWIYLAVRTGPGARHRGLSVLVAPLDTPGHHRLGARDARRRHDRRGRAGGRRGPARPARRRAARRLVGADGHARPRAGDEREGRRRAVAARPARRAGGGPRRRALRLLRLRGEAEAAREHGRRAAELLARGPARRPGRARWRSSRSPC